MFVPRRSGETGVEYGPAVGEVREVVPECIPPEILYTIPQINILSRIMMSPMLRRPFLLANLISLPDLFVICFTLQVQVLLDELST